MVLDLAAGPGGAGLAGAERVGPGGSVVLSDVSPAMVAAAARRARDGARVAADVFDQSAIPFDAASFDAVINRHGLMFVDDPAGRRGGRRDGWRMWVAPGAPCGGTGQTLLEAVADWARDAGADRLQLAVTDCEESRPAAAFYRGLGFTETGEQEPLDWNPSLIARFLSRPL